MGRICGMGKGRLVVAGTIDCYGRAFRYQFAFFLLTKYPIPNNLTKEESPSLLEFSYLTSLD